jgi:DNA-binding protein HU-beta
MTLNHKDLMTAVANLTDLPISRVEVVYAGLAEVIRSEVAAGRDVKLNNLLAIKVEPQPERQGRNPSTGLAITIEAKNRLKITPTKSLKDALPPVEKK